MLQELEVCSQASIGAEIEYIKIDPEFLIEFDWNEKKYMDKVKTQGIRLRVIRPLPDPSLNI